MKKALSLLLLIALLGCQNSDLPDNSYEIKASLEDGLAYDGCALHFYTLPDSGPSVSYVPTPGTKVKAEDFLAKQKGIPTSGPVSVILTYRPTATKGKLVCGWGAVREVDAIDVLEIRREQ